MFLSPLPLGSGAQRYPGSPSASRRLHHLYGGVMPLTDEDRATLSAYLDGELDEESAHEIEVRLTVDPELRHQYETLRQAWSLLDYLPRPRTVNGVYEPDLAAPYRGEAGRRRLDVDLDTHLLHRVPVGTLAWAAGVLLAGGLGFAVGGKFAVPADPADNEEMLVRHLRVVERLPVYQEADDVDFLRKLDTPELFGSDSGY